MEIIPQKKSIIVACDVSYQELRRVVKETAGLPIIGGYKIGVSFLDVGVTAAVKTLREYTEKTIIYDHQKAGNDIPEHIPQQFMDALVRSGIDAVILFPFAGPISQYAWTNAAQERNLGVMVGGEMTHARFLENDLGSTLPNGNDYTEIFFDLGMHRDLSGYLKKFAPQDIYELAARMGVQDFVMPGTKKHRFKEHKALVENIRACEPIFYSPGFITQGGNLSKAAQAAGERFHPIVGRMITEAKDIKKAVEDLEKVLLEKK